MNILHFPYSQHLFYFWEALQFFSRAFVRGLIYFVPFGRDCQLFRSNFFTLLISSCICVSESDFGWYCHDPPCCSVNSALKCSSPTSSEDQSPHLLVAAQHAKVGTSQSRRVSEGCPILWGSLVYLFKCHRQKEKFDCKPH